MRTMCAGVVQTFTHKMLSDVTYVGRKCPEVALVQTNNVCNIAIFVSGNIFTEYTIKKSDQGSTKHFFK